MEKDAAKPANLALHSNLSANTAANTVMGAKNVIAKTCLYSSEKGNK